MRYFKIDDDIAERVGFAPNWRSREAALAALVATLISPEHIDVNPYSPLAKHDEVPAGHRREVRCVERTVTTVNAERWLEADRRRERREANPRGLHIEGPAVFSTPDEPDAVLVSASWEARLIRTGASRRESRVIDGSTFYRDVPELDNHGPWRPIGTTQRILCFFECGLVFGDGDP